MFFHFLISDYQRKELLCVSNELSSIVQIETIETKNIDSSDVKIEIVHFTDNNILGICPNDFHKNPKLYNKVIFLNDKLDFIDLINTYKHEFGHFLGLSHSIDTNSIMYPINVKSNELSRYDSLKLKQLFHVK